MGPTRSSHNPCGAARFCIQNRLHGVGCSVPKPCLSGSDKASQVMEERQQGFVNKPVGVRGYRAVDRCIEQDLEALG